MPASGPTSRKKKEDISDKVKEIKQRQLNWLKQREQTKHSDNSEEFTAIPKTKVQANGTHGYANRTQKLNSGKKVQSTLQHALPSASKDEMKKDVKDRFKHWRQAKQERQNLYNEGDDNVSDAESELERLMTPDLETVRQPVAEEDFIDLADQIAQRVKGTLGLDQTIRGLSSISSETLTNTSVEDVRSHDPFYDSKRVKTFTQEVPTFNHRGSSGLISHSCIICKKLMLSSSHIPMMVIPCGHTLCKSCSDRRSTCPSCDCPVLSLTVNIMLQQVIQEYHSNPTSMAVSDHHDHPEHRASPYKQEYVEDNRRNKMASYEKQLINLQTRQEILSGENKSLKNQQYRMQQNLNHEQSQVKNITKQEKEVSQTIWELQQRLEGLQEHRQQYEIKVKELHDEGSELEGKASLLSTTLSSLSREIEKVKLLAEAEEGH